jgi:hypothetical protein
LGRARAGAGGAWWRSVEIGGGSPTDSPATSSDWLWPLMSICVYACRGGGHEGKTSTLDSPEAAGCPGGTASLPAAPAALRGASERPEPSDGPERRRGRGAQAKRAGLFHEPARHLGRGEDVRLQLGPVRALVLLHHLLVIPVKAGGRSGGGATKGGATGVGVPVLGAAGGGLRRPRPASTLLRRRSDVRTSGPSP